MNNNSEGKVEMSGFKGNLFQLKLFLLNLHRELSSKYQFELGTKIEEAYKYDNLFFEHEKIVEGKVCNFFTILQSNHKEILQLCT